MHEHLGPGSGQGPHRCPGNSHPPKQGHACVPKVLGDTGDPTMAPALPRPCSSVAQECPGAEVHSLWPHLSPASCAALQVLGRPETRQTPGREAVPRNPQLPMWGAEWGRVEGGSRRGELGDTGGSGEAPGSGRAAGRPVAEQRAPGGQRSGWGPAPQAAAGERGPGLSSTVSPDTGTPGNSCTHHLRPHPGPVAPCGGRRPWRPSQQRSGTQVLPHRALGPPRCGPEV